MKTKSMLAACLLLAPLTASASMSAYCENTALMAVEAWQNHADGMPLQEQRREMRDMCLMSSVPCWGMIDMVDSFQGMPHGQDSPSMLREVFREFYRGCMQAAGGVYQ